MRNNINPRTAPRFDLTSGEIRLQLPRKAIEKITDLVNAAFILKYVPELWKVVDIIMSPKLGKSPKLFDKLLLKRMKPIIVSQIWI